MLTYNHFFGKNKLNCLSNVDNSAETVDKYKDSVDTCLVSVDNP
jgi:hypothetical protein